MLTNPAQIKFVSEVTTLLHKDRLREAALCISDFSNLKLRIESDNPADCMPPLQFLLHYLLNSGGMEEAAQLLWSPRLFNPGAQFTKDVWNLFDTCSFGLIMGAASTSKSYSMGVRLMLEWVRDPQWTNVKVVGPSEDHLQANLFSHLVALHAQSKIPLPGSVGDLFIGMDRRNRLSSISGVIIPIGNVKKAGRLQGAKRKPRPEPHPIFGELSRMMIFLDELENVPDGVWSDLDNVMANVGDGDITGLKIFGAFNPQNQQSQVGKRCEPKFGWSSFDVDRHYRWTSTRDWEVLRLDGERCENVVQGKVIFPGLQTRAGLDNLARKSGGKSSPGYMSMGRGAHPPIGIEMCLIPQGMMGKVRGEFIWLETPTTVGSCDLALLGKASAIFSKGLYGLATGVKFPPNLEFPAGRTVMFKDQSNHIMPRPGLMLEQQMTLPKGDTVAMKNSVVMVCRKSGIRPEHFAIDRTGNGAGVCDLIRNEWSSSIHDVNFSSSSSESKLMAEDTKTCKEEYDRLCSELWGALNKWMEFGVLMIHPQVSLEHLTPQITTRRYRNLGGKVKIESKEDFFSRGGESPDDADSLTLLILAVRRGMSVIPSMTGAGSLLGESDGWDDWAGPDHRVDVTNRSDFLNLEI